MRKAAYAYGQKLLPRKGAFDSLYYALNLNDPDCKLELVHERQSDPVEEGAKEEVWLKDAVFVSPDGDDRASGEQAAPLRSIQLAADRAASGSHRAVVLRGGTHYITSQIVLGARHSGLRIASFPGEKAFVSGGKALTVDWKPYKVSPPDKPKWDVEAGMNAVYGATIDNKTFVLYGKFDDAPSCQAACAADAARKC